MQLSDESLKVLKALKPQLETWNTRSKIWTGFLIVIIIGSLYSLYEQIRFGHGVTGMRDHVVWGLYIANFVFFIGISYAGAVIAGVLHLFKISWRKPIMRIAVLVTISSAIIGPFFILLCMGRFDRLHHLIIYPRLQSPITWDVLAISTYIVGAILFLYLLQIRDFAIFRDYKDLKLPEWRRKLYGWLALGYTGTPYQKRQIEVSSNLLAIILIPMIIVISSVLSWIFGMTLRPGWHSTIFGPYFVIAATLSGVGTIIVVMWGFRKIYKLERIFHKSLFIYLGYILLILAALYGYFTFSEYLTSWYGSEKWDSEVVRKIFDTSEYGWWFIYSNIFGIIIPIIVVAIPKFRTINLITLASFFMVIAMWIKRYLIVIPTLETPLLPIQDVREEYLHYSPTLNEWILTLGGVATFLLIFTLFSKFFAVVSVAEYEDKM
jgi:molybdopterin-containing oxidoreductase family membrane subunit